MGRSRKLTNAQARYVRKAAALRKRLSNEALAVRFDVSYSTIWSCATGRRKEWPGEKKPQSAEIIERTARMCQMYRDGLTLKQIGSQFGVTRERVRQLLVASGVRYKDSGRHIAAMEKKNRLLSARIGRMDLSADGIYGCDRDEMLRIKSAQYGLWCKYVCKRTNMIRTYGESQWRLTLPQYVDLMGAVPEREIRAGGYVLTRVDDSLPFEIGNCRVVWQSELSTELRRKEWTERSSAVERMA